MWSLALTFATVALIVVAFAAWVLAGATTGVTETLFFLSVMAFVASIVTERPDRPS